MIDLTYVTDAVLIGAGATLVMDLVALVRRHVWGIPALDYALVGRWALAMRQGQFVHRTILATPPARGEIPLGWALHYLIGIGFAAVLLELLGTGWRDLSVIDLLWPALLTGVASVLAPYLILQPGFGFGIAAAHTPKPALARWRSLVAHLSFGLGLFLTALIWRLLRPDM
ncbi:DUF2938 family protein [Celeribacter neptunius]|nr:DUF2938 family protein [Celeribacter neptunius]